MKVLGAIIKIISTRNVLKIAVILFILALKFLSEENFIFMTFGNHGILAMF